MSEEKRMAGEYEITHSVHIGDQEIVMGESCNAGTKMPFMTAICESNGIIASYNDVAISDDFTEAVEDFGNRLAKQAGKTRAVLNAPMQQGVDISAITSKDCDAVSSDDDLNGKTIVINPDVLRPEYRKSTHQLQLCTGGNGAFPKMRGSAVYCKCLYDGRSSRFERQDVLGMVKEDSLPEWAQEALAKIQKEKPERRQGIHREVHKR